MGKLSLPMILICAMSVCAYADMYVDDFGGDLSNWTAGPSHLDSYGIINGELFLDGKGHLTGSGGWGVLQFNEPLGSRFTATWDAKVTYYEYANFTLSADPPWEFNTVLGYPQNGYVCWLDIDDPTYPLLDLYRRSGGTTGFLSRNVWVTPDIPRNQWFSWKVEMDMGHISVYLNDRLYINRYDTTFTDSNFKIGLSFGEDSRGYIDNFQVNVVPAPGAALLGLIGLIATNWRIRKHKMS